MAVDTPKTGLRGIDEGQSDAHVLYNDSMNRVDSLILHAVIHRINTPPGSPPEGATYVVGDSPTGVWSSNAKDLVFYFSDWIFVTPIEGYSVFNQNSNQLLCFDGTNWAEVTSITLLTDNSGGTANDVIAIITDAQNAGSADLTPTRNAIADLAAKVNEIATQLKKLGAA